MIDGLYDTCGSTGFTPVNEAPHVPLTLFLHEVLNVSLLWGVLIEGLFFVLLKYALANPLVVAEDLPAWPALMTSWRMTKNRIGYVFSCYLLVAVAEELIKYPLVRANVPVVASPSVVVLTNFLGTCWYVLPWVMYSQIKAADGQVLPDHLESA